MAKVLVSLLGTGKSAKGDNQKNIYQTVDYQFEGRLYEGESLTTLPIVVHHQIDRLYWIGTAESMWDNVAERLGCDEAYVMELMEHKEHKTLNPAALKPLEAATDARLSGTGSRCKLVADGETDAQMWGNFDLFMQIFEELSDGDVLYLDITHLFRSLSVIAVLIGEIGSIYKNIPIKGVFYGMLKKDEPSPILNMAIYFELLEWAKAISYFKKYGSPEYITKKLPRIADQDGIQAFQNFSNALMTSDVDAIEKAIPVIKGKLSLFEAIKNHIVSTIIVNDLKAFIDRFESKTTLSLFQLELAKFYLETKNYPMFYLVLTEAFVSKACEREGLDPKNEESRGAAKERIKGYRGTALDAIRTIYYKVNAIRINIAHKTSNTSTYPRASAKDVIANAEGYLNKLIPYFKE